MAAINYDSELRRAGANATHGWRRLAFLAQRHMLGTIGLFIMVLFVLAAVFADLICRLRSAHRRFRARARPSRARGTGWAPIPSAATSGAASSTARASRSRSASARPRSARSFGVTHRPRVRISLRLGRSGVPARHRYPAGPAAAGAGAGDDGGAGTVAAERDHRDRDPPDPDRRPRHPRQHAGAARAAVCRGRQVDRHERDADRAAPRPAEHAGAADRAGHRAARLHHPDRSLAVVSRPRHSRALSVVGPHAVGIGGGICPHRAMAGDLSRHRHQPRGVRNQSVRRRACATSSIRGSAADERGTRRKTRFST